MIDPVLLCNDLGTKREAPANAGNNSTGATILSSGHHSMSVKEAVRIAQSNNFMGLVCSSRLLVRLPPLVHSRIRHFLVKGYETLTMTVSRAWFRP